MNLKSIEYFLITAEEMNITKAAERLMISQQGLSAQIKRMENEYNVKLFERYPTLRLTPEGEQMVYYGKRMLAEESAMRSAFSDISINAKAILKVGMSRLRSDVFFPEIWKYYHSSHPNISIELVDGNSLKFEELLQDGKIDMYIGVDVLGQYNEKKIELGRERIQCVVTKELFKQCYPDTWEQMEEEFEKNGCDLLKMLKLPFITLNSTNRIRRTIDRFFEKRANPNYILKCEEQQMIFNMSRQGVGVGLLSPAIIYKNFIQEEKADDSLLVFDISNDFPDNTVNIVYLSGYKLPKYQMDFIQLSAMVFRRYFKEAKNLNNRRHG